MVAAGQKGRRRKSYGRRVGRKGVLEMIVLGWARISGGNSTNVLQKSISGANENRPESLFSLAAPVSLGEFRTSLGKEVIARMSAYSRTPFKERGAAAAAAAARGNIIGVVVRRS